MTLLICIIAVVAGISLYDYFSNRTWNQVTSDLRNDIVFEHRNQAYGAYKIRRDYNRRLLFILFGFTAGIGGLYAATHGLGGEEPVKIVSIEGTVIDIPLPKDEKPEIFEEQQPETTQPAAPQNMSQFIDPVVTDEIPVEGPQIVDPDVVVGAVTITGGDEWGTPTPAIGAGGGGSELPIEIIDPGPTFNVDEVARYVGDRPAMVEYLQKNFRYPAIAIDQHIEGKVYTQFVVSKEGDVHDVKIQRGIKGCTECDNEAVRVINKMPRWIPARTKGKPVASYFNLPIVFDLAD